MQLFATNDKVLTGHTGYQGAGFTVGEALDGFGSKAHKIYDLDAKADRTVNLEYRNGNGSGSGDLYVYIPFSVLNGATEKYLSLYSAFGVPNTSAAGFEEWSVATRAALAPEPVPAPLPGVAWAGLTLLGGVGLKRLRRRA